MKHSFRLFYFFVLHAAMLSAMVTAPTYAASRSGQPYNVELTQYGSNVLIKWVSPIGARNFVIQRRAQRSQDWKNIADISGNARSYTDRNLDAKTHYEYRVIGYTNKEPTTELVSPTALMIDTTQPATTTINAPVASPQKPVAVTPPRPIAAPTAAQALPVIARPVIAAPSTASTTPSTKITSLTAPSTTSASTTLGLPSLPSTVEPLIKNSDNATTVAPQIQSHTAASIATVSTQEKTQAANFSRTTNANEASAIKESDTQNGPHRLDIRASGSNQATLTWQVDLEGVFGYSVERRIIGKTEFREIKYVRGDVKVMVDEKLIPATEYEYRVKVFTKSSGPNGYLSQHTIKLNTATISGSSK